MEQNRARMRENQVTSLEDVRESCPGLKVKEKGPVWRTSMQPEEQRAKQLEEALQRAEHGGAVSLREDQHGGMDGKKKQECKQIERRRGGNFERFP